jgi:hypothetical protein
MECQGTIQISTLRTPSCRFCYSYKPPGLVEPCCVVPVCATNSTIQLISTLQPVIYNNSQTTERSLLLYGQQEVLIKSYKTNAAQAVVNTQQNLTTINRQLTAQLIQLGMDRYQPYQPYMPPVIPSSVIQLNMQTRNVGVPVPVMTIASCKGNQFVTT